MLAHCSPWEDCSLPEGSIAKHNRGCSAPLLYTCDHIGMYLRPEVKRNIKSTQNMGICHLWVWEFEGVDVFVQRLWGLLCCCSLWGHNKQTSCSLKTLVFCSSHICLLFLCHQLLNPAQLFREWCPTIMALLVFTTFALLIYIALFNIVWELALSFYKEVF